MNNTQYWSIWYPKAGNTGLLVARGQLDPSERLIVHAAPPVLTAEVYNSERNLVAFGQDLEVTLDSPMCLLTRLGDQVTREDIWPDASHHGLPVLLPGGEVALLKQWWHAEDQQEWRWQVEFYNSVRSQG